MPRESYSYARVHVPHANEYKYPPLLDLQSPPLPDILPLLPSPLRSPSWISSEWQHSTHIVPAAWPRTEGEVDLPKPPQFDATTSKEERSKQLHAIEQRLRELRENESGQTQGTRANLLWICMNRYVRRRRDGRGVTLFLAHANGFNKETWEPTLRSLLNRDQDVSEIWIWEAVNHGDSSLLNQGKLNSLSHWREGVRDLLQFLIHYLPTQIQTDLPVHVPRIPSNESALRQAEGFLSFRKLVMVGHSYGGCISTLAAMNHPVLFSSIFLIDPTIMYPRPTFATAMTIGALGRRHTWSSKQEALSQMQLSPFFQRWHPDVLEAYVEYGLYDTPDGRVTLKMHPVQEAVMFSGTWTGCVESWIRLYRGELEERIELRWLFPGRGEPELGGPGHSQPRAWLRKGNSSNVLMEGASHLVTHEQPDALAEELAAFLQRKYGATETKL